MLSTGVVSDAPWFNSAYDLCQWAGQVFIQALIPGGTVEHLNDSIWAGFIKRGKPKQNAPMGRYDRTVRYDRLNLCMFDNICDGQKDATKWFWIYNRERPNMALNSLTSK